MLEILIIFLIALLAGFIGSIFGLGGGSILVPLLDIALPLDIHYIIPASLVCTVSTALSSNAIYLKKGLTNVKLAMVMVPMAALGAYIGAHLMIMLNQNILRGIFGAFLIATAYNIWRKASRKRSNAEEVVISKTDSFFADNYYDESRNTTLSYAPKNTLLGASLAFFGGLISALLGVGGGIINMPILLLVMGLPAKVATAISLFIISLNGAIGGTIYLLNGYVDPFIVAPAVIGILVGVRIGGSLMIKMRDITLRKLLAIFFLIIGLRMIIVAVLGLI